MRREPQPPAVLRTKLRAPPVREDAVARPQLVDALTCLTRRRLTVIVAPTGYGKTTLLAQWLAIEPRAVAWLSLDDTDNDPVRFWLYLTEALGTIVPGLESSCSPALRHPGASVAERALPLLLNELALIDEEGVVVLDDYHAISAPSCHESLEFFIERMPATLRVVVSTRANPALRLGLLRARGELGELRAPDLRLDTNQIGELVRRSAGIELSRSQLELVEERTEGWPAGCCLAALSLRERPEPEAFLWDFAGSNRHLVDYLGTEVLSVQEPELRAFMLRTAILEELTAQTCDELLDRSDSDQLLARLEAQNSFVVALDNHRSAYRYHQLFRELLRFELAREEPALVPELHARAARICEAAGDVDGAVRHALGSGCQELVRELAMRVRCELVGSGRHESARLLLQRLGAHAALEDAELAVVAAWVAAVTGSPETAVERWLERAERIAASNSPPGPELAAEIAIVRASFVYGDVGRCVSAAERAHRLAGELPEERSTDRLRLTGEVALAYGLLLAGDPERAATVLEDPPARSGSTERRLAVARALAVRSLALGALDIPAEADACAREATAIIDALGVQESVELGVVHLAHGLALARAGELADAAGELDRAVEVCRLPAGNLRHAHALLELARVRSLRGNATGARLLIAQAREAIAASSDPGALPATADRLERSLGPGRARPAGSELSDAEVRVLRLLSSRLTQREIARELYLSMNTVKTHVRAIHRKLGVSSRQDAVGAARRLGIR